MRTEKDSTQADTKTTGNNSINTNGENAASSLLNDRQQIVIYNSPLISHSPHQQNIPYSPSRQSGFASSYMPRLKYFNLFDMPSENAIWLKSATYSINSFLFALQIAVNAKMLAMVNDNGGDAAGAIVATFQNVTVGTAVSLMLSTGIEMSDHMATRDYKKAGNVVKNSWILTGILGSINLAIQLSSPWTFPYLFEEKAAKIASNFFLGYAVGSIPGLFMTTNLQVAFHTNDLDVSTFTVMLSTIPGVFLSYFLAFTADLGAVGLGIGATLPNFLSAGFIHYWLSKQRYSEFEFYQLPIEDWKENLIALIKTGSQLALQRLTEWGNLFAITLLLSKKSPDSTVSAIEPAIQYSAGIAFALQGLAHATAMMIKKDRKALKSNLNPANRNGDIHANTEEATRYYDKIYRTLIVNHVAGTVAAGAIFIPFYFASEPLANFFLSDDADEETKELASEFLWLSMLGLVADGPRIVSLGALRSWDEVLWPTFMCFLTMSFIAIPAAFGISKSEDDWTYMVIVRNLAMLVSAALLGHRCAQKVKEDKESILKINNANKEMGSSGSSQPSSTIDISCCYNFFGNTKNKYQPIQNDAKKPKEKEETSSHTFQN